MKSKLLQPTPKWFALPLECQRSGQRICWHLSFSSPWSSMFHRFVHTNTSTERLKHSAERTFPSSTLASSIIAKTHQDPNVSLGLGQSLKGSKYHMLQHKQSLVSPTFSSNVQASIKAGWYDTLATCTTTSCLTYVVKLMT